MDAKIVDFLETAKESDGHMLPFDKEMLMKSLIEIPHDVAKEYSDTFGNYIEDILVIKNIISSSDRPHLVKHLVAGFK